MTAERKAEQRCEKPGCGMVRDYIAHVSKSECLPGCVDTEFHHTFVLPTESEPTRRRAVTTPETDSLEMPPHHYEEGFVVIETTLTGDTGARIEAMRLAGIQLLGEGGFLGDVRVTIVAKGQVRRNG